MLLIFVAGERQLWAGCAGGMKVQVGALIGVKVCRDRRMLKQLYALWASVVQPLGVEQLSLRGRQVYIQVSEKQMER